MFNFPPTAPKSIIAPAEEWLPYLISDFSGGLNTEDPSSALRKEQFSAMLNWYIQPDRTLKVRGPWRPWLAASDNTVLPDSAPPLTFIVVELRGTDYWVASWDSGSYIEVSVYDETNNRWCGASATVSIDTDLTDYSSASTIKYPVKFVKFSVNDAEDLIFCNGKDTPQRWVGTITAGDATPSTDLGLAVPVMDGAEDASEDNALGAADEGITKSGVYTYKFTYFYDDSGTSTKYGESGPSAALTSADLTNATSANPVACDLDLDLAGSALPSGVSKCNVYRSPPDQAVGPFEYVGYFTSGDTYKDNRPNGEEGVEGPIDAGTPPKLKNPLVYAGRVWGIGINAAGALNNKGVWTEKGYPDFFTATNFINFPDPLAGPALFNKQIYWFTEKQVWVTTDLDDPVGSTFKICDIGCDSWDSIVDVGNGLVWQYDGNIYWANFNEFNQTTGDLPWAIGDPIRNKIDDIPSAQITDSNGVFYKDRYYLSITGPNQTFPTSTLVWDVKNGTRLLYNGLTGAWSSVDWAANFMQTFNGTLYTADNGNKHIMEHDFAGAADFTSRGNWISSTSTDIATELATGDLHFGNEWSEKIVNSLSIMTKTSGVTMNAIVSFDDNTFSRTKSFELGTDSLATDSTWLVWGQGTWGNFNWGSSNYKIRNDHKTIGSGGKGRNAKLTLTSSDSEDTNLIASKIYYKILPTVA